MSCVTAGLGAAVARRLAPCDHRIAHPMCGPRAALSRDWITWSQRRRCLRGTYKKIHKALAPILGSHAALHGAENFSRIRQGNSEVQGSAMPGRRDHVNSLFLFRGLRAFLAGFRQTNRNRLLSAFHPASFSPFAGTKRAVLFPPHGALDALPCRFAIPGHCSSFKNSLEPEVIF